MYKENLTYIRLECPNKKSKAMAQNNSYKL